MLSILSQIDYGWTTRRRSTHQEHSGELYTIFGSARLSGRFFQTSDPAINAVDLLIEAIYLGVHPVDFALDAVQDRHVLPMLFSVTPVKPI